MSKMSLAELKSILSSNLPDSAVTESDFDGIEKQKYPEFNNDEFSGPVVKFITQCEKYCSLFKQEHEDGSISYTDNNRIYCIKNGDTSDLCQFCYPSSFALLDQLIPISLPYTPSETPYLLNYDSFYSDRRTLYHTFDTLKFIEIQCPDGTIIPINKFYKIIDYGKTGQGTFEIDEVEYKKREKKRYKCEVFHFKKTRDYIASHDSGIDPKRQDSELNWINEKIKEAEIELEKHMEVKKNG